MPDGKFAEPGTIARPLVIGRAVRLVFAAGTFFLFIWYISRYSELVGSDLPPGGYWIAVGIGFFYLPELVNIGFSRGWGRWPEAAVIPFALALIVVDALAYGSAWGPPLGWFVFVLTEFVYALFALSFLLAAALAVPG